MPCSSMSPQSRSRAAFASGLFSEPAAGRLPLALRRLVCRHILNPIFVRLRFLIFLIALLSLRHGNLLVESANTSPGVSFVFRLRLYRDRVERYVRHDGIRAAESIVDCRSNGAAKRGGLILYFDRRDLKKGRARSSPRLPLFAVGIDPCFDHFPGVRSLDNLVLLRRTASQFGKAKPRSILASDGDLPRCHQRHMGSRGERITPALFRNKAAQFLSPCRRARRSPSRSLVSPVRAPTAAKPTQPLATWRSPSNRRPRCSTSQAGRHRRRFCNRRSPPLPLSLALCSRRCRVLDVQPMRRTPTTIGRTEPLGHDALAAESARMAGRRVLRHRRRCTHCRGVLWAQHRQKFHKAPPVLA